MRVTGLGYEPDYFTLDAHDVVHVAVSHVDPLVRALAPVWLPRIAPAPLCGLGNWSARRRSATRSAGVLCRPCSDHVRVLDDWVRHAEAEFAVRRQESAPQPDRAEAVG